MPGGRGADKAGSSASNASRGSSSSSSKGGGSKGGSSSKGNSNQSGDKHGHHATMGDLNSKFSGHNQSVSHGSKGESTSSGFGGGSFGVGTGEDASTGGLGSGSFGSVGSLGSPTGGQGFGSGGLGSKGFGRSHFSKAGTMGGRSEQAYIDSIRNAPTLSMAARDLYVGDYGTFRSMSEQLDNLHAADEQDKADAAWGRGDYGAWMGHKLSQLGHGVSAGIRGEVREWGQAPLDKLADTMRGIAGVGLAVATEGASLAPTVGITLADDVLDAFQGEVTGKRLAGQGLKDIGRMIPGVGIVGSFVDDPVGTMGGMVASGIQTGNPISDVAMKLAARYTTNQVRNAVETGAPVENTVSGATTRTMRSLAERNHEGAYNREQSLYASGRRATPPADIQITQDLFEDSSLFAPVGLGGQQTSDGVSISQMLGYPTTPEQRAEEQLAAQKDDRFAGLNLLHELSRVRSDVEDTGLGLSLA